MAIGKAAPSYALDIQSDTEDLAVNITRGGSLAGNSYGLKVNNSSSGVGVHRGIVSEVNYNVPGTATDRHIGLFTSVQGLNPASGGTNTNENIGIYNQLANGSGSHTGFFNSLSGTEDSKNVGISNYITNGGNKEHYGVSNILGAGAAENATGNHTGVYNQITGAGLNIGTHNKINNVAAGKIGYGTYNEVNGAGAGTYVGGYFTSTGTNGTHYAAIFDQGNVGIGTASPTEKLEVKGKIKATTLHLTNVPQYSSNGNAKAGGLVAGDVYMQSTSIHNSDEVKGTLKIVYD